MLTLKSILILVGAIALIFLFIKWLNKRKAWKDPTDVFPLKWRKILLENITFYNNLSDNEKDLFEYKIQEFLTNVKITGVDTDVDIVDKILVASSAIIPIFEFSNWQYTNLTEVLIYPAEFNSRFESREKGESLITAHDKNIAGMVGTGYMNGKMILSKIALRQGFAVGTDKKNTAIHEFVHLIDKMDGSVDGIPEVLMERQYAIPWLDLIRKKIEEIYKNKSDINPYGTTNQAEFFAVACEYFFERPKLLKSKHPKLYATLESVFKTDLATKTTKKRKKIRRNDNCPCGSDEKYKNCCYLE